MDDKKDLNWDELTNINIDNYYDQLISVSDHNDINYDDWLAISPLYSNADIDIGDLTYPPSTLGANDIKLNGGGEEMLRVAQDGFYVRGIKVEADAKEAEAVYKAFKQWMTYAILNGEINNR
jgi:hypothetical protein